MRTSVLVVVSFLFFLTSGAGVEQPHLRVDVAVARSEYCETGGFIVLRLTLELKARNTGPRQMIVSKLIDIDRYELDQISRDLTKEKFRRTRNVVPVPMLGKSAWAKDHPSSEYFHLIPARGEISLGRRPLLLILSEGADPESGRSIKRGAYHVRIRLDPWRESRRLGRTLLARWVANGDLQLNKVTSEPFSVSVGTPDHTPECMGPPILVSGKN